MPEENKYELEYIPDIEIFPLNHFSQIVDYFVHGKDIPCISQTKSVEDLYSLSMEYPVDLADIK